MAFMVIFWVLFFKQKINKKFSCINNAFMDYRPKPHKVAGKKIVAKAAKKIGVKMKKLMTSIALVGLLAGAASAELRVYRDTGSGSYIDTEFEGVGYGYTTSTNYSLAVTNVIQYTVNCGTNSTAFAVTNPTFRVWGDDPRIAPDLTSLTYKKGSWKGTDYRIMALNADGSVQSNLVVESSGVEIEISCSGAITTNTVTTITNYANIAHLQVSTVLVNGKRLRYVDIDYDYNNYEKVVSGGGYQTAPWRTDYYGQTVGKFSRDSFAKNFSESASGANGYIYGWQWGCGNTNITEYLGYVELSEKSTIKYDANLSKAGAGATSFQTAVEAIARKLAGSAGILESQVETVKDYRLTGVSFYADYEDYYCATTNALFYVYADQDNYEQTYYFNGNEIIWPED